MLKAFLTRNKHKTGPQLEKEFGNGGLELPPRLRLTDPPRVRSLSPNRESSQGLCCDLARDARRESIPDSNLIVAPAELSAR